jgi:hypothetical protein
MLDHTAKHGEEARDAAESIIRRFKRMATRFGGKLIEAKDGEEAFVALSRYTGIEDTRGIFSQAPFTSWDICVYHKGKVIAFSSRGIPDSLVEVTCALIHEFGHVFACHQPPGRDADEIKFLCWELELFKRFGYSFDDFQDVNRDYGLGDGLELGELPADVAKYYFMGLRVEATKNGLFGPRGNPIAIR